MEESVEGSELSRSSPTTRVNALAEVEMASPRAILDSGRSRTDVAPVTAHLIVLTW